LKAYFYEDGYLRTSSREYTLDNYCSKIIHLTNDAVQKRDENYGKFESGNKLSFSEFQRYLDIEYSTKRDILPKIKVSYNESYFART
jgi:hypothetical protein